MRITFVMPHAGMAGGNRVIAIYASQLSKRGHLVEIVSQPPDRPSLRDWTNWLLLRRPWPVTARTAPYFQEDPHIRLRTVKTRGPVSDDDVPDADIVIATWWETAEWVAALSARKGIKVQFVQHHEVFSWLPVDRCEASYRLPLRKIVISRWLKDLMENKYHAENVFLVPNSVDQKQFSSVPRKKQEVPTVGFLYSTVPFKGVDVSLSALTRLKTQLGSLRAIAFGAEPISPHTPLPEWVEYHYLPAQDELKNLYSRCDSWLCSSRSEGFYLPLLEAMACRCPVVSTKVGGPLDTVIDGINGYLVDVDDDVALSDRLLKIMKQSEADWKQMSDAAYETATRYTWEDAAALFEQALQTIIREARGPAGGAAIG
jgi:glycosyltransferase involved in cell wall biosynthesis